jgi:hypothetical protein
MIVGDCSPTRQCAGVVWIVGGSGEKEITVAIDSIERQWNRLAK